MKTVTAICILGLLAVGACERRPGRVLESKTASSQGVDMLVQLYNVAHYGPERQAVFWCRTARSRNAGGLATAKSAHLEIDSDDWLLLVSSYVGPYAGQPDAVPYKGVPLDRAIVISPAIAYADMGAGAVVFTFDGCRTRSVLSAPVFFQQLFVKGEIKRVRGMVSPRAFTEHRVGDLGICLRLNPEYQAAAQAFDVCTADLGKSWYARAAKDPLAPPAAGDDHYSDTSRHAVNLCPGARRPATEPVDCAWQAS